MGRLEAREGALREELEGKLARETNGLRERAEEEVLQITVPIAVALVTGRGGGAPDYCSIS